MIFGPILISIAWLTFCVAIVVQLVRRGHVLSGALFALGASGFGVVPVIILPAMGSLLDGVELPAYFGTTTIVGPRGKRYALIRDLSRVQRYDKAGRFEKGWFVGGGGWVEIGLTTDDKIAVLVWRPRQVEMFNPDGSPAGQPISFPTLAKVATRRDYLCPSENLLCPSEYLIEGVSLQNPTPVNNPGFRWNTLLLLPLWHPIVAWLLLACGIVIPALQARWGRR
ncbi:MAG TPA: hypothetical protein VGF29_05050 [Hyphomicrobiaceae bacterium]|jgi:hypothetical protein